MSETATTSRNVLASLWLLVGAAMIAVPTWLGWASWRPVLEGHPALPAVALFCGLLGVVAVVWAVATLLLSDRLDRDEVSKRTPRQTRRRERRRIVLAIPALVLSLALIGIVIMARPIPATEAAIRESLSTGTVRVADRLTWLELVPTRKQPNGTPIKPTVGFVFSPGAQVEAGAYVKLLKPLAVAGYLVAILKEPLGLALLDENHPEAVMEVHPEITRWAVGGHSVGGVAAARFADTEPGIQALVLYGTSPGQNIAQSNLLVLSVAGGADARFTPADQNASKQDLPRGARYLTVPGATHSFFGDYGDHPEDGVPGVSREKAQAQIISATATFLATLTPKRK
ncbi:MAG TPA: alpha/beta hydrolase [Propionibacteriaceae bacterium]|nr:alpha/beta hydrolase [Propionibacteriaceae bacterium]